MAQIEPRISHAACAAKQGRGARVNEIKSGLLAYLMDEQPFLDFQDWLTDLSWAPVHRFSPADVELIREIELRVAEFTGGFLTEEDLRVVLREIAGFTPRVVRLLWEMESAPAADREPPHFHQTTSSSQTRRKVAF